MRLIFPRLHILLLFEVFRLISVSVFGYAPPPLSNFSSLRADASPSLSSFLPLCFLHVVVVLIPQYRRQSLKSLPFRFRWRLTQVVGFWFSPLFRSKTTCRSNVHSQPPFPAVSLHFHLKFFSPSLFLDFPPNFLQFDFAPTFGFTTSILEEILVFTFYQICGQGFSNQCTNSGT